MMIPNMVKYPILMLPILTTAIVSGLVSALVGIHERKSRWIWFYRNGRTD